jgi:single-strand DNA-binding protein
VIVVGHIYTSEYDDRGGNRRSSVEVRATSVGPDLARCTARIDRIKQPADEQVATLGDETAVANDDDDADQSGEALPLTA